MTAWILALMIAAAPAAPKRSGTFRRAVAAADGVHLAVFLYLPERPLPGAPWVMLVPDIGTTHDVFDVAGEGLARELVAEGVTVGTFDWRGTGLSQVPDREATLDELVTLDLPAAVHAVGEDRPVVLLGWGWGGALAYAAAAGSLKGQVRGVVALNSVVQADVANTQVERLLSGGSLDLSRELASPAPQRRGSLFDLLWVHGAKLDDGIGSSVLAHALVPITGPQVKQLQAWSHEGQTTLGGKPYPALLHDLDAPVLAFFGMADNWTHPEFASPIVDFVPRERMTGHPVTTFEGFDEDLGHLGLVLGNTSRKALVPVIVTFVQSRGAPQ